MVQRKDPSQGAVLVQCCGEHTADRPEAEPWSNTTHTREAEHACSTTAKKEHSETKSFIHCPLFV